MKWDEEKFGLEYDLDIFNVVAVNDFNMGKSTMKHTDTHFVSTSFTLSAVSLFVGEFRWPRQKKWRIYRLLRLSLVVYTFERWLSNTIFKYTVPGIYYSNTVLFL